MLLTSKLKKQNKQQTADRNRTKKFFFQTKSAVQLPTLTQSDDHCPLCRTAFYTNGVSRPSQARVESAHLFEEVGLSQNFHLISIKSWLLSVFDAQAPNGMSSEKESQSRESRLPSQREYCIIPVRDKTYVRL